MKRFIFLAILTIQTAILDAQPTCFATPYFSTGGNWFMQTDASNHIPCITDQCIGFPYAAILDIDVAGDKIVGVLASGTIQVSAVFFNYGCDTALSVQCSAGCCDTIEFGMSGYGPYCAVAILTDVPFNCFVLPNFGSVLIPLGAKPCAVSADTPTDTPITYRRVDMLRGIVGDPQETQPPGWAIRSDGVKTYNSRFD